MVVKLEEGVKAMVEPIVIETVRELKRFLDQFPDGKPIIRRDEDGNTWSPEFYIWDDSKGVNDIDSPLAIIIVSSAVHTIFTCSTVAITTCT